MSRTFKQPGLVLTYENGTGSAISAGDVVVTGDTVGVANVDIANGDSGALSIEGVHEVAKVSGTAWVQGDSLDWDASESAFTKDIATPAAGDVENCAIAAAAAASADTTGEVKLTPGAGAVTSS